ncbi:MAG: hypothetical protein IIU65_03805 [Clostridia bacterium]|nr:hypothetical protein [Clostridia bacterium]
MCRRDKIDKLFKEYNCEDELLVYDGVVTEGEYTILFILKESNISNSTKQQGFDDNFWFKNVYKAKKDGKYFGENLNRLEKSAQTKYYNCITQIAQEIAHKENVKFSKIGISYININKNGGSSICNNVGIAKWLTENSCKKEFLLKQIKIIKPQEIVIFSCNKSNLLIKNFADEMKNKYNYNVVKKSYHPSRYKKQSQTL